MRRTSIISVPSLDPFTQPYYFAAMEVIAPHIFVRNAEKAGLSVRLKFTTAFLANYVMYAYWI